PARRPGVGISTRTGCVIFRHARFATSPSTAASGGTWRLVVNPRRPTRFTTSDGTTRARLRRGTTARPVLPWQWRLACRVRTDPGRTRRGPSSPDRGTDLPGTVAAFPGRAPEGLRWSTVTPEPDGFIHKRFPGVVRRA